MNKTQDLTKGDVEKTIIKMTLTLVVGTLAMVVYGFVDTAIVGQLGQTQLAVLGFAYPVTFVLMSIIAGLSIGTATAVARIATNREGVTRLVTDGLIITFVVAVGVVVVGIVTIEPLFYGMGATDAEMPYILKYMTLWYLSAPLLVFTMLGNNTMRALGNAKVTALVSSTIYVLALLMDPLFILGIGFFPRLGIVGSAVAILIGRFCAFLVILYFIRIKTKLISLKGISIRKIGKSAKKILHVAIPCIFTKSIIPIGVYVINGFLAVYGSGAVAGFGAGQRVERLAMHLILNFTFVMIPFAGQNFGAGKLDRLKQGIRYTFGIIVIYSVVVYAAMFFAAPYIATIFNESAIVQQTTVMYLRIALAGMIFQGGVLMFTSMFNAVGKPFHAAGISVLQVFVIYVPLAYLLSQQMGPVGIFVALVVSYVISMAIGYLLFSRFLRKEECAQIEASKLVAETQ